MTGAIIVAVIGGVIVGILLAIPGLAVRLLRLLYVGPWIEPWVKEIQATIEGEPWYKTEGETLKWLVRRISNAYSQENIVTLEEQTRYVVSWLSQQLQDEKLPKDAKALSDRCLELETLPSHAYKILGRSNVRIGLERMTCLVVVKFRNTGKGIGDLVKLSDTNGQLTRLDHGFWCRLNRRWFCSQPHHTVCYKLEPQVVNLPLARMPIRTRDEGYLAKFKLVLQLDRDYQGTDDGRAIRDILAWADFSDFAKRGMRGKVRLRYTAQHGRWFWDQKRERERLPNVPIRIPLTSEKVDTRLARELAAQAQNLYNYHRDLVVTEVDTGEDK